MIMLMSEEMSIFISDFMKKIVAIELLELVV